MEGRFWGSKLSILLFLGFVFFLFARVQTTRSAPLEIARWHFEDSDLVVDYLDSLLPTAQLSAGPALSSPSYQSGNPPTATVSVEYSSWSTSGCGTQNYLEFLLDLTNFGGLAINFDERRSATGPQNYKLQYSVNSSPFFDLPGWNGSTSGGFGANPMHTHSLSPGSTEDLAMRGQSNVRLRLYGCDSGGNGGKLRVDNISFTAATNPTAVTLTDLDSRSVNGKFEWLIGVVLLLLLFLLINYFRDPVSSP